MNKITDAEIFEVLNEKFNTIADKDKVLGIFTYGKVNYGFAETKNDIEYMFLTIPSFEELCNLGLQVELGDIRNSHIDEILLSKYKILNPKYENIFNQFLDEKNIRKVIQEIIKYSLVKKEKKEIKLTETEKIAYQHLLNELGKTKEGNISISQLIDKTSFSRPVYTNLLQKISESGIAEVIKQGVKGTYVKIL